MEKNIQNLNDFYLKTMVFIGFISCLITVATSVYAPFQVPDYNWISDTISDLAAGDSELIMDLGIYSLASAQIAVALGTSHLYLDGKRWLGGIICFVLLAVITIIIGARNEYGDSDNTGLVIHSYIVPILGVLFTLAPLLFAKGIGTISKKLKYSLVVLSIIWSISAISFYLVPTQYDGIFERFLGIIAISIISLIYYSFLKAIEIKNK